MADAALVELEAVPGLVPVLIDEIAEQGLGRVVGEPGRGGRLSEPLPRLPLQRRRLGLVGLLPPGRRAGRPHRAGAPPRRGRAGAPGSPAVRRLGGPHPPPAPAALGPVLEGAGLPGGAGSQLSGLRAGAFDLILANPPWGHRFGRHDTADGLHDGLLAESARIGCQHARLVVITHELRRFQAALGRQRTWVARHTQQVELRGHHPRIWVLARDG